MPGPRWLARFNRRVTNRLTGAFAPYLPGMGIIVHTGRKSGRAYRTPVNVFRHGNRYVIALTYGPKTEWVQNILAAGGGTLETHGQVVRLSQPRVFHDVRRSAVPVPVRIALGILQVADFVELTGPY